MNFIKKFAVAFVTFILLLSFPVLPGYGPSVLNAKAATPKMNVSKCYLIKGKTKTLKLKNASGTIKWSSENRKVATVTQKGVVKGVKKGTAKITALYKGKRYRCTVVVETPKLSATKASLTVGKTKKLSLSGTKQKVRWSSKNTSVATVTSSGQIKAKKAGTTKIYATAGGSRYTCTVTVLTQAAAQRKNTITKNYNKLCDYIKTTGVLNGNNDLCIQWDDQADDSIFTIVYEASLKKLRFVAILGADGSIGTFDMYLNTPNSDYITPEFNFLYSDFSGGCQTSATLRASTYTGKSDLTFYIAENHNMTNSHIQSLTNAAMRLSFAGWNQLLKSRVGLTLNDLGFTAYR